MSLLSFFLPKGKQLLGLSALITISVLVLRRHRRQSRLPPDPRGIPILGNLLEVTGNAWLDFSRLAKQYGEYSVEDDVAGRARSPRTARISQLGWTRCPGHQ